MLESGEEEISPGVVGLVVQDGAAGVVGGGSGGLSAAGGLSWASRGS